MSGRIVGERWVETDDEVRLFSRVTTGPDATRTPVVCSNGVGVSTFFWKYLERDLSPDHPVVVWDYRGHGRSGRPADLAGLTIQRNARDLLSVLDAHAIDRAVLAGHSMGVQVILETYRIAPGRVAALVPMFGTYGRPLDTFFERPVASALAFLLGHKLVMRNPARAAKLKRSILKRPALARVADRVARLARLVHPDRMPRPDFDAYLSHFGDVDPEVFFRMAEKMAVHTADDILESVEVPVLVVAGEKDLFTPLWLSEEMADRLPRARLLVLADGSHAAMVEQPELVNARVREFLADALGGG